MYMLYDLAVDGTVNKDATWCYRSPKATKHMTGDVAF